MSTVTNYGRLEMASRVADEYGTKDSQIDSGNLYAALRECLNSRDQMERDFLTINREWDEEKPVYKAEIETLKAALMEVIKVLESENPAIVDTVWVSSGQPETLRDHCHHAVYGYLYEGEERA